MEPNETRSHDTVEQNPQPTDAEAIDVAQSLEEAEAMLSELKARYEQIQQAQAKQPALEARLSKLKAELKTTKQPEHEEQLSELKAELETVKTQLAATWEDLESQLITWRDHQELFWQFLRFAGIGFALAMLFNHFVK